MFILSICCIEGTTNNFINGKCFLYITSRAIFTQPIDMGAKISQTMEYYSMALYILIDNEIVTAKYTLKVENKTPVFQRNRPMSNENKNKKQFMKFGIRYWVNHNSFFLSYIYNIIHKNSIPSASFQRNTLYYRTVQYILRTI